MDDEEAYRRIRGIVLKQMAEYNADRQYVDEEDGELKTAPYSLRTFLDRLENHFEKFHVVFPSSDIDKFRGYDAMVNHILKAIRSNPPKGDEHVA